MSTKNRGDYIDPDEGLELKPEIVTRLMKASELLEKELK